MNSSQLITYVRETDKLNEISLKEIESAIEKYPYLC
jgi:hypothetical protein